MKAKGGRIETDTLIGIVLLLAFLFIATAVIFLVSDELNAEELSKWACWMTNGLKDETISALPTSCSMYDVEEKAGKAEISAMITDTWWMYGKGDRDLGLADSDEPVFRFTAKEEISFEELLQYMITHKDELKVEDKKDSDYNYVQEGSEKQTLCWGEKIEINKKPMLKDGEPYFIVFWDDAEFAFKDKGDKIIIAKESNLEQEGKFICQSEGSLIEISEDGIEERLT